MNESQSGNYAVVTGATSGIGYELARLLAQDGFSLILVARTQSDLEMKANEFREQFGVQVIPIAADLFDPMSAFDVYDEIRSRGIVVDILVNDAGQGEYGKFIESDIHRQLDIIQLNVSSLTVLTHLFLKDMVARDHGKILQLASIASDMPHPLLAVYAATKAYVMSFTQALINELKGTNVTLTALQPGATDTDFFNKAGAERAKVVQEGKLEDAAKVARVGYDALMQGDNKEVSGLKNKVMSAASNIIPDQLNAEMVKKTQLEEKKDS